MKKSNILKRILLISSLIGATIAIFQVFFGYATGIINIVGTYGSAYVLWAFDSRAEGGNGGNITLIESSEESSVWWSGIYIDTDINPQRILGNFFLETVGWIDMLNVELTSTNTLSGYAWSENAGYIDFTSVDGTYSWVSYLPWSQSFTGYAWSETIWYLSFESWSNLIFKNKVKILGNIGGNKAFDTEYALGTKFESTSSSDMINSIRKNVSLMTRALPNGKMNTLDTTNNTMNDIMYYKRDSGNLTITNPNGKMKDGNRKVRSLTIVWGDLVIDNDIEKDINVNAPRVIIVLKDESGNWGNVYIKNTVKNIYTSIIAEGSLYSWDSAGNIYNDTPSKLISLPNNQLYVYGTILSRNTIGWSSKNPVICPFTETSCTYENSLKYDWNYFRTFDKVPTNRSDKSGYDEYSIILETDPRIISDPPPGIVQ